MALRDGSRLMPFLFVAFVVGTTAAPARGGLADYPDPIAARLAPFEPLLEPGRDLRGAASADPTQTLIDSVFDLSRELGFSVEAEGVIRAANLPEPLAARLATTLSALLECRRVTAGVLRTVSPEAMVAAALGNGSLDSDSFAGIRPCAIDLWRSLGELELHLRSSRVASTGSASVDLWPVLRLELGSSDDTYVHDYVLLVDVAGNDTYANNAGSNVMDLNWGPAPPAPNIGPARGCQTALDDFRAGNCFVTAGALLDLSGEDTYGVFETPDVDARCTADPVVRRTSTIGAGLAGVGILRDASGNDRYNGKASALGAGHIFGVGILSDAEGDDSYLAVRNSQGFALLGGFGLLHDESGSDTYDYYMPSPLDPEAPNETPGAGGTVDDIGLCDRIPRFVQGAGNIGQGIGLLVDDQGDDAYRGALVPTYGSSIAGGVPAGSQGFGAQGGTGFFFDRGGSDVYVEVPDRADGATVLPGEASTGTGLFVDQSAQPVPVQALGFSFLPAVVTVPVGGTVEWHNDSPAGIIVHTVTTADGPENALGGVANDPGNGDGDPETFDHPLAQGGVVSHTFERPGIYDYFCRPHHAMGMVGRVIVTGSSDGQGAP